MLKAESAVLVVVDIQGKLATLMHGKETLFENAIRMIKGCLTLEIPILWNEQLPDKLGETIPEIRGILKGYSPLIKKSFSCTGNDAFMRALTNLGRRQVLLMGIEAHVCVYQTAIGLLASGFEAYLIADCVSSRTPENKQIGIQAIVNAGARLSSVETALFEILRLAEGDKFKEVMEIVK